MLPFPNPKTWIGEESAEERRNQHSNCIGRVQAPYSPDQICTVVMTATFKIRKRQDEPAQDKEHQHGKPAEFSKRPKHEVQVGFCASDGFRNCLIAVRKDHYERCNAAERVEGLIAHFLANGSVSRLLPQQTRYHSRLQLLPPYGIPPTKPLVSSLLINVSRAPICRHFHPGQAKFFATSSM